MNIWFKNPTQQDKKILGITFLVLVLVNITTWKTAEYFERKNIQEYVEAKLTSYEQAITNNLRENSFALSRMASRWEKDNGTSEQRWRGDANSYSRDLLGVVGVAYADKESVIKWIEPLQNNLAAIGFKLTSEKSRNEAIQLSLKLLTPQVTRMVELRQGGKGYLLIRPVFANGKLDGYIYLVSRFESYFQTLIKDAGYYILIKDEDETLYKNFEGELEHHNKKFAAISSLPISYSRNWKLYLYPKPGTIAKVKGSIVLLAMFISFIFSGLIFFLIMSLRKLEEAKNLADSGSRAKADFLATMSHEIRTPLNGIIGMSSLLKETELNEQQSEYLRHINESGTLLLALINDILDFSKIDSGKLEFEVVNFNLEQAIDHIVSSFSYIAKSRGIELRSKFDLENPHWVLGDVARLKQVLINLVNNALKFTQKGYVEIHLDVMDKTDKQVSFRISVQDSGIGISSANLEKLFQNFSQAESSTSRRFGGTGLGLAISKSIVEKMGGKISVKSTEGEGSTFYFDLVLPVGKEELIIHTEPAKDISPTATSKRILIAEDNLVNQKVAEASLKKLGYISQIANNGSEALQLLDKFEFDLVLMDCQMPEMDGFEATRQIRKSDDLKIKNIPVIAMTANAMAGDKERCIAAGMNDYITKPVTIKGLSSILDSWLNRKL